MHPTAHIVLQPDCIKDRQVGTALEYLAREGFRARTYRVVQLRRDDLKLIYPKIFLNDVAMSAALVRLHHSKPSIILEVVSNARNSTDEMFARLEKIKNGDPLHPTRPSIRQATHSRSKIENRIHFPSELAENIALQRVAKRPRHDGARSGIPKNIRARSVWLKWLESAKSPVIHFTQSPERDYV